MLMQENFRTYLSVVADESYSKLCEIVPSLKPIEEYLKWEGWRELDISVTETMGLFVSISNHDSSLLIDGLGALDIESSNSEKSTKAWLHVEILALCERLTTNLNSSDIFPITFALSERLKIVDILEDTSKARFLRSENQRKFAEKKWGYQRKIKEVASELFSNASVDRSVSSSELMALMQSNDSLLPVCNRLRAGFKYSGSKSENMIFLFDDGAQQGVSVRTIANWRSAFNKARNA